MPWLLSSRKHGYSYWFVAASDRHDKKSSSNAVYQNVLNETYTCIENQMK